MGTKAPAIGIDLGSTNSCVAVGGFDKVEVIAKDIGSPTTPTRVAFTDTKRLVGDAAMIQKAMNEMATKAPVIGIDLGTTNSCVAVYRFGKVEVIANDIGSRTTPACVAFTDTERLVGEAAMNQIAMNRENTIYGVKRLIGCNFREVNFVADLYEWPFKIVNDNSLPKIKVTYKGRKKIFCPEEISAMILAKMKETAEAYLGMTVKDAVIAVPVYFNDSQKLAIKDAGTIAGLNVLRIINEPTAAAIAFGFGLEKEKVDKRNILIYDFGGGTTDVTLLTIDKDVFKVISTEGDPGLGGENFDIRMVNHFVEHFKKIHQKDLRTNEKALIRLRTACERAKKNLSSATQANIEIDSLLEGIDYQASITRAKFEELNAVYFKRIICALYRCLYNVNMDKAEVDEVVIVGGSSRIPKIQKTLQESFIDRELNKSINPDEAVAYGAAVQAAILTGDHSANVIICDVTPLSLGIEVTGGFMDTIIKRNTPIPTKHEKIYETIDDNQTTATIKVLRGWDLDEFYYCVDEFTFKNLPPKPKGEVKFNVTFTIDINGILTVSATENITQRSMSLTIKNERERLSEETIKRMQRRIKC